MPPGVGYPDPRPPWLLGPAGPGAGFLSRGPLPGMGGGPSYGAGGGTLFQQQPLPPGPQGSGLMAHPSPEQVFGGVMQSGLRDPYGAVGTPDNPIRSSARLSAPAQYSVQGTGYGGVAGGGGGGLLTAESIERHLADGLISPQQAEALSAQLQRNEAAGEQYVDNIVGNRTLVTTDGIQREGGLGSGTVGGGGGAGGGAGGGGGSPGNAGVPGGLFPGLPPLPADAPPFGQPLIPGISPDGAPGRQAAYGLLGPLNAALPGFEHTIPPGYAGFEDDNRAALFNLMSGIFANDPAGIGGSEAPSLLGAATNMSLGQAIAQEQRNQLAQRTIDNAAGALQQSAPVVGAAQLGNELTGNPFTTSGDALQAEIESMIQRRGQNARQGVLSGLRDAQGARGTFGGESDLLTAGADFGSREAITDAMTEARVGQALRRAQDIQNTSGALETLGGINQRNIFAPATLQAEALGSRNNPFMASVIEQIRQLGGLGLQDNLREAVTDFSPVTAILGGAGSLLGGALGAGGLFGEKGLFGGD